MAAPSRRYRDFGPAIAGFGVLFIGLLAMEVLIRFDVLSRYVVPPPSEIALAFERVVLEEGVFSRFLITGGEALAAGILLTLVGVPMGLLLYRYTLLRQATETWIAGFAAAPLVLAYPLFLVIFGRNASTIVAMGFISGLPPVILKTLEGFSGIRPVLLNVGRSFKLTSSQTFWRILLPAALPTIFAGLRLGLIFALINIVGVEFLINFGGLGPLINELAERYDLPGTYAAICFVILVSILVFVSLERIERWLRQVA